MSLAVSAIGTYLPSERKSLDSILSHHQVPLRTSKVYRRLFGLDTVCVAPKGQSLEESLKRAFDGLPEEARRVRPDLVVHAHCLMPQSTQDDPFLHRLVMRLYGNPTPEILGVAHMNCVSLMSAISLVENYLDKNPEANAVLLLAGDQLNILGDEHRYLSGSSIMGDAAVAILISRNGGSPILGSAIVHDTEFHDGLYADAEKFRAFYEAHDTLLDKTWKLALDRAGLSLDDISWILPHNMNRAVWARFAERTGFAKDRIATSLVSELGHTYTVDPFLNWQDLARKGLVDKGQNLLLLTVGIGSFVGAFVVKA